jgi:hypothetical protein
MICIVQKAIRTVSNIKQIHQARRASGENRLLPVALPGQLRPDISMRAEQLQSIFAGIAVGIHRDPRYQLALLGQPVNLAQNIGR